MIISHKFSYLLYIYFWVKTVIFCSCVKLVFSKKKKKKRKKKKEKKREKENPIPTEQLSMYIPYVTIKPCHRIETSIVLTLTNPPIMNSIFTKLSVLYKKRQKLIYSNFLVCSIRKGKIHYSSLLFCPRPRPRPRLLFLFLFFKRPVWFETLTLLFIYMSWHAISFNF